jgi:glycosyltransferase involved in cell wall biosynthesis
MGRFIFFSDGIVCRNMNVIHINTFDRIGGAAIAALRLHNTMLKSGINSNYLVLNRGINDRADITTVSKYDRYITQTLNMLCRKIETYWMKNYAGLFSSFSYGVDISKNQKIVKSDVIYLHWIGDNFVNHRILKKILKLRKPVFWFMHDMFPITGGCHYSLECTRYQTQCQNCPYCGNGLFDISAGQFRKKKKLYKHFDNLSFIAPSKWLFECVKRSALTESKVVYHIPNLIDPEVFKPLDKNMVRKLFSLNYNKMYLAFGAHSALNNDLKGWSYVKAALNILFNNCSFLDTQIEVIIFGSSHNKKIADEIPFPSRFLGHLYDEYTLAAIYNAIDVFVIPSLAENFPNTILESLSCDTPVVGFNVGGIPDMVNEHTGYLAEYKNAGDLAKGLSSLLKSKENRSNIRRHVSCFFPEKILNLHKIMWTKEICQKN